MLHKTIRSHARVLLSGLLLTACGGVTEPGLAPEEQLGTRESALCTNLYVDNLSILGVSSYNYEAAGSGEWQVSTGANAVRLEYYIDGVQTLFEERVGTSGTWYFSASPMSCGAHTFEVKAYPMVIDSTGNRTTCTNSYNTADSNFAQYCAPTVIVSCGRSGTMLQCTGPANGGVGPYGHYWQRVTMDPEIGDGPIEGSWVAGTSTKSFACAPISAGQNSSYYLQIRVRVVDSTGTSSTIASTGSIRCARG